MVATRRQRARAGARGAGDEGPEVPTDIEGARPPAPRSDDGAAGTIAGAIKRRIAAVIGPRVSRRTPPKKGDNRPSPAAVARLSRGGGATRLRRRSPTTGDSSPQLPSSSRKEPASEDSYPVPPISPRRSSRARRAAADGGNGRAESLRRGGEGGEPPSSPRAASLSASHSQHGPRPGADDEQPSDSASC